MTHLSSVRSNDQNSEPTMPCCSSRQPRCSGPQGNIGQYSKLRVDEDLFLLVTTKLTKLHL